jgi:hypothetical protein
MTLTITAATTARIALRMTLYALRPTANAPRSIGSRRSATPVAAQIALRSAIAHMDAHTKLDAALRLKARIALDRAVLHLDGAAHGVDDASELYENAVTRPLYDAPVMHGDGGIDQIAAECP